MAPPSKPTSSSLQPPSLSPSKPPPESAAVAAGYRILAGVDEAGRGPWAGPVVAAAVIVPEAWVAEQNGRPWACFGVRVDDSKRLSPPQRERACELIRRHAAVGVGIVDAEAIDTLNIHRATLQAMACALADLPHAPELALIDGLHAPAAGVPCRTIVDGDHLSYSVACASIVAKVIRDDLMRFYHRLFPEYGFDQHKGYGTRLHVERLRSAGPCWLHRQSFQPVWEAAASTVAEAVTADAPAPVAAVEVL